MARGGRGGRGGGRGGRVHGKETRSCHFCLRRGHLKGNCPTVMAIQGLVQLARADGTLV
ncbi:hypothetical protein PCG10_010670, partial [Penicillium crustosum]